MGYRILGIWCGLLAMVGCTQQPQQVRRLSEKQAPDSALLAQIEFNQHMSRAADNACREWVRQDSSTYALDDFGFWYTKTVNLDADSLQQGEQVLIHLTVAELNGQQLADVKDIFAVGTSDLPLSVNLCLKQMSRGEQMRIIAPWYAAYGTEGTQLIKPYTNLIITLTIINE